MKRDMLVIGICLMLFIGNSFIGAAVQHESKGKAKASAISPDLQLISPIGNDIGLPFTDKTMRKWVIWPSREYIKDHAAPKDRKKEVPPIYREGVNPKSAMPLVPGAKTPSLALYEATLWIEQVLDLQCIPQDLQERLLPIQMEAAKDSAVICRFEVNGNKIQVFQNVWAMCFVIQPGDNLLTGVPANEAGPIVFKKFFAHGSEMAAAPAKKLSKGPKGLDIFIRDDAKPFYMKIFWCNWMLWYTDGKSVAVFLRKLDPDNPYIPSPNHPWF